MPHDYYPSGPAHDEDPDYFFLRNPDTYLAQAFALQSPVSDARRRSAQESIMEARDSLVAEDRLGHVYRALEYDPANVDALLFLLELYRYEEEEELEHLQSIVDLARRLVDPLSAAHANFDPEFPDGPTPGLRVRFRCGVYMQKAGRYRDAAELYEEMLRLDHHDLIGVRYDYAVCLFVTGEFDLARALLDAYREEDDGSPVQWLRVLERMLAGEEEPADALYRRLRGWNQYVEEYLTGALRPPDEVLQEFDTGSMDEAVWLYDVLHHAWDAYPESLQWLRQKKAGG